MVHTHRAHTHFLTPSSTTRVKLSVFKCFIFYFQLQYFIIFFHLVPPFYILSFSHITSLLFIFLSPPPTPDVIATEKRPLVEKGVRLAGPPSHLARRGGGGGGRSSGSMFESKPSPPPPLTLVTSEPCSFTLRPTGGAVGLHESAVPLVSDTIQCDVTV